MSQSIRFHINDKPVRADAADSDMALIDYLHERHDLTGTKFCCGIGICRACTVATRNEKGALMEKTLACSTPVSAVKDMRIYTVEGLGSQEDLAPLQRAFLENFSFQCGYCAPGFLMAATAMLSHLKEAPVASAELDDVIQTWVGGNLCRCTGYVRYMEAIRQVALPYTREALEAQA
jgi:aerobic-type carbon monoxide dehydrogenase small subunit (CoxS/CutS family)